MKLGISAFLLFIMGIVCRLIACLDNRFASIGALTWFFLVAGAIVGYAAINDRFDSDSEDEETEEESDDDETEKPKP